MFCLLTNELFQKLEKAREEQEEADRLAAEGKLDFVVILKYCKFFIIISEKARKEQEEADRKAAEGMSLINIYTMDLQRYFYYSRESKKRTGRS